MADSRLGAVLFALLAALMYGIIAPLSKILLGELSPFFMAALLYLGAGIGVLIILLFDKKRLEARLTQKDLPFVLAMVLLDILAPIFLMLAVKYSPAAHISLLNNVEIVFTAVLAMLFFKESIGRHMWKAILIILVAAVTLSLERGGLHISQGTVYMILACLSWGLENNCTRMLSLSDPKQIVVIKGVFSGLGSMAIAVYLGEAGGTLPNIAYAMLLGFVSIGLSLLFYIRAQRVLGAARTSAYYAVAPFAGVLMSFLILGERPKAQFYLGLLLMLVGTYYATKEAHEHLHQHDKITHSHAHVHDDLHHDHSHAMTINGKHAHEHTHEKRVHVHAHTPDLHHRHTHE